MSLKRFADGPQQRQEKKPVAATAPESMKPQGTTASHHIHFHIFYSDTQFKKLPSDLA